MEYLVQYGRPGYLGRFQSDHEWPRDTSVVIESPRGRERGIVLAPAQPTLAHLVDHHATGAIIDASPPDDDTALSSLGDAILHRAQTLADDSGLSLSFIDIEILLDGTAILDALVFAECNADSVFETLSEEFGRPIKLHDVSRAPSEAMTPSTGCGKEGCGSAGGSGSDKGCTSCGSGCSTGGCSKGKVKDADELTTYFANLRKQMESPTDRYPLH